MMKNLRLIALTAALSGTAMAAWAQAPTPTPAPKPAPTQQTAPTPATPPATATSKGAPNQLVELTAMDANRDGLVSRQEYMTHYEGLYGKLKKDSAGMISLKDLASSPTAAAQ